MKVDDILTLIKAGYTKDDIEKMTEDASPVPDPQTSEESPTEEPAEPEKPKEAAQPEESALAKEISELKKQILTLSLVNHAADIPNEADKLESALKKLIGG